MSTESQINHTDDDTDADRELEPVGFDDLRGRRSEDYHTLVTQTARLVRDGLFTIDECKPSSLVGETQRPSDAFTERFQAEVSDALDDLADTRAERETAREQQQSTVDATEIDWPKVWADANVEPGKPLSFTQAALAVDVSKQTPINDQGAKELLKEAAEIGQLREFETKQMVAPAEGSQ